MIVPADAHDRLPGKAGFGEHSGTYLGEGSAACLQGRQDGRLPRPDQSDQLVRPAAIVDREILRARGKRMVGGGLAAEIEGDPVRHQENAFGAPEDVRPMIAHPCQLEERHDRFGGVTGDGEDARRTELLRQIPRLRFRPAVEPGDRSRPAISPPRRRGRSSRRCWRPRSPRPAGRQAVPPSSRSAANAAARIASGSYSPPLSLRVDRGRPRGAGELPARSRRRRSRGSIGFRNRSRSGKVHSRSQPFPPRSETPSVSLNEHRHVPPAGTRSPCDLGHCALSTAPR